MNHGSICTKSLNNQVKDKLNTNRNMIAVTRIEYEAFLKSELKKNVKPERSNKVEAK